MRKVFFFVNALFVFLLLLSGGAGAQVFNVELLTQGEGTAFSTFVGTSAETEITDLNFAVADSTGGYAYLGDNTHRLTRNTAWERAAIWNKTPIDMTKNFEMKFSLYFGNGYNPGDGMAFVFHQLPLNTIGVYGGCIGYGGVSPSFAVEFDDYKNVGTYSATPGINFNDPAFDHIAFCKDGNPVHTTSSPVVPIQNALTKVSIGQWYNAHLVWKVNTLGGYDLSLYMVENDNVSAGYQLKKTEHFAQLSDFISSITSKNNMVTWGLTSSTGGAQTEHRVKFDVISNISYTDSFVIHAVPEHCWSFVKWIDKNGKTISTKNPDTLLLKSDTNLTAVFESNGVNANVTLTTDISPLDAGITTGEGNYECDSVVKFTAVANPCYTFACWTDAITGDTISYNSTDSIIVAQDTSIALMANFKGVSYGFLLRAGEHLEVSPNKKNYPIPIYIKPEEDINNFTIREIKLTIDRNIFYPQKVTQGTCIINHNSDTIILNDIQIGYAPKDVESVLCTLYGTMLLGNIDSSLIHFIGSTLNDTCVRTDFIDGYITIEICEDGGERLLESGENPSIKLCQSDLQFDATVEIFALEKGQHTLSITNLYGSETQLAQWENQSPQTHYFHLPSEILPNGVYFLLLRTPNQLISSKIILTR